MNTSAMLQQSAHRDVLELPIPDTESSKRGLLEELKNRGRSAVGGKAWPDARLLYEKALAIVDALPEDNNNSAILNSNLSLVLTKMGIFDAAQDHAQKATTLDPTYVKGWWRLGQAQSGLKLYKEALNAMEQALKLEPDNKALKKECDKLRELAANAMEIDEQQQQAEAGPKTEPAPPRAELHKPTATTSTTSTSASSATAKTATTVTDDDEEDKGLFTKSEPVRGYKIVNGKKTSYFHNELSEEAKSLIGDIAPKKLETPAAAVAQPSTNGTTSAWNQAGTWEERDVTKWAKESLQEQLLATTYTLPESSPAPGALSRITKATVTGHASFATVRGKKRYIYEFKVDLEWAVDTSEEIDAAKGKVVFPDMDGSCELGEGYDLGSYEVTAIHDNNLRPILDRFVKNSGLRDSLHQTMDDWVREFRNKY